jgi:PAS domain S-box-containing protein
MADLNLQDARILIVDDQEANVLFLEGLLHEGGYRSWRSVLDPRVAAAACAEFQPDLVLLDLLMPDLDGFGVLGQLQPFLAAQAYLPVLVLTVDLTPESRRRALAVGAKDFLAKPLDATEVLLRVKNLLETRFLYRRLQQRADERIREQAALIDQANDAILVCDLADRITFWSRGAEKLYGWTAADVQGRAATELLFKTRPAELGEANRAVTSAGRWEGELPQVARDGREIVVASRWTLLYDAASQPRSKLVINTDITEMKKTESKLLRAQRMENIDRLASGIAHDLNNTFVPLEMGIDLLRMTHPDLSDNPVLVMMRASVRRGTDMVRQILTFSRGREGARRPVPLRPLVDESTSFFRQTFPKAITITTQIPEKLWLLNADPTQMYQLLANLCINARDAMPQGGSCGSRPATRRSTVPPFPPRRASLPGCTWCWPLRIRGPASPPRSWTTSLSPSSRPRRWARGPAWGWRRRRASSAITAVGSKCTAPSGRAPGLRSTSLPWTRRSRGLPNRQGVSRRGARGNCCSSWTTKPRSSTWPGSF